MLEYLIKIDSGQYLSDVLSLIPNNTILNKTLTGCGATTMEINAPRNNSIIIEPNVPVIIGKKQQHPFLMPVYEGTTINNQRSKRLPYCQYLRSVTVLFKR